MIHLAVAHALALKAECEGSGEFYVGSLAPDAVYLRPGMCRDDKRRTHLYSCHEDGTKPWIDRDRIRRLLFRHWAAGEETAFAEGYAVHVLTDAMWHDEVILPYRERVRGDGRWDEMPALYYRDCDAVDVELYFCYPWRPEVWAAMRRCRPHAFDGLVGSGEVAGWRERALGRLEAESSPADLWPLYLEAPEAAAFAKRAAYGIGRVLETWRGQFRASSDNKEATA